MNPLPDVEFIQGDFHDEAVGRQLVDLLAGPPSTWCCRTWHRICRGLRLLTRRVAFIWPRLRPTLPAGTCNRTVLFSSKLPGQRIQSIRRTIKEGFPDHGRPQACRVARNVGKVYLFGPMFRAMRLACRRRTERKTS